MLQTIVDWRVRRAASRWPSELREDQTREWLAELHSMRGEESGWAQLRFAWSLAWSPPVEDANGVIA